MSVPTEQNDRPTLLEIYLTTQGRLSVSSYVTRVVLTLVAIFVACFFAITVIAPIGQGTDHEGVFIPFSIFLMVIVMSFGLGSLLAQCIRRLRDAGVAPLWSALLIVPGVNLLALLIFALLPTKRA